MSDPDLDADRPTSDGRSTAGWTADSRMTDSWKTDGAPIGRWVSDGWMAVPEVVPEIEVAEILAACDRLLACPPAERWPGDKPTQGTRHLNGLEARIALVGDVVARRALVEPVQAMLGHRYQLDQASFRSPGPGFGAQRLHADAPPMLEVGPATVATAIVALVDFTAVNGATRLVPGSHLRPDLQRRAGSLEHHEGEIVMTGRAGTAFVFSGHVLHSGTLNRSDADRPTLQLCWRRTE